MADPTLVNGQITDAVTQANVKVLADAPAQAMGNLYQVAGHATGLSIQSATANQQNMNTIDTGVTTQGVNLLYTMPVAADARGTNEIFSGNALAEMIAQLKATLQAFPNPPERPVGAGQPPSTP